MATELQSIRQAGVFLTRKGDPDKAGEEVTKKREVRARTIWSSILGVRAAELFPRPMT